MTPTSYEDDLIHLLLKHGRITHIVKAGSDAPVSALALVQRCMSANITQVVPLSSTTAAVFTPGGVPPSLRVFGIETEKVDPSDYGYVPLTDRSKISAALDELEEQLSTDESRASEAADAVAVLEQDGPRLPADETGTGELLAHLTASVAELSRRLEDPRNEMSADFAALAGMIEGLSGKVDALAATRSPTENSALAAAVERLEAVSTGLERDKAVREHEHPSETVLRRLADALEAVAPRQPTDTAETLETILREIGEVTSLQHLALTQLAALLDSNASLSEGGLAELLADVRLRLSEPAQAHAREEPTEIAGLDVESPRKAAQDALQDEKEPDADAA